MERKQVKIYVEPETYEKLVKIAEEVGVTVPRLVKNLVLEYLGEIDDGTASMPLRLKELEEKYERLSKELGRVHMELMLLAERCCKD